MSKKDVSKLSNEQLKRRSKLFFVCGVVMILCAVLMIWVPGVAILFLIIGLIYFGTSAHLKSELKKRSDVRRQLEEIQADIQKRINERKQKGELKPFGIPSGKVLKQTTTTPVGIMFDCIKGDFTRQDILINLLEGDSVSVEKYKYKSKDAYMLICNRLRNDFGVINATLAKEISEKYPTNKIEGYISKTDFFYADDRDETIYTCRVKLYIVENE